MIGLLGLYTFGMHDMDIPDFRLYEINGAYQSRATSGTKQRKRRKLESKTRGHKK